MFTAPTMRDLFTQTGFRFLWIAILGLVLDQYTKYWVLENFVLYESIQITSFFNLTYVRNYGAAFSFLHDAGGWQRYFFTGIAFVVSAVIIWWLKNSPKEHVLLPVAFSFILGGAIGNVIDRLMHGYVVDFLDFYYGTYHWPAFNIADSVIFIGAGLLIIDMFINKEEENK
jgi:signal peptidase II